MSSGEQETHSFIIKLWLDQEGDAESRGWHGQITHVPGGERQSLKSLEDILKFIAPFVTSASATFRYSSRWSVLWRKWWR